MTSSHIWVFGEVLFDCFPTGEQVLGGAPFNVAWHLQALGDKPLFISQVGNDTLGRDIIQAMQAWGMDSSTVTIDRAHPTGTVNVELIGNEASYTIQPDCAYDFISQPNVISNLPKHSILYHGTLGLRHSVSRTTLLKLINAQKTSIFLDINLRSPWWQLAEVNSYLAQARWVKLNASELRLLGFSNPDYRRAMTDVLACFPIELLILTLGENGATVLSRDGQFETIKPGQADINIVDTVGAGDAFSAMFIHGINAGWSITKTLLEAHRFAVKIIGCRGATSVDLSLYQEFKLSSH